VADFIGQEASNWKMNKQQAKKRREKNVRKSNSKQIKSAYQMKSNQQIESGGFSLENHANACFSAQYM
jgi:hypothetical protein